MVLLYGKAPFCFAQVIVASVEMKAGASDLLTRQIARVARVLAVRVDGPDDVNTVWIEVAREHFAFCVLWDSTTKECACSPDRLAWF